MISHKLQSFAQMGLLICLAGFLPACDILGPLEAACTRESIAVTATGEPENPEGICAPDGACTLREAINTANFCGGDQTIALDGQQLISLTLAAETRVVPGNDGADVLQNVTSLPPVTGRLTIEGNGATVSASSLRARILRVDRRGSLTIRNTILSGGIATPSRFREGIGLEDPTADPDGFGGVIFSQGPLNLEKTTVERGFAILGGGLYAEGPTRITDSRFSFNSGYIGGAIYSDADLTLETSGFDGNRGFSPVTIEPVSDLRAGGDTRISDSTFLAGRGSAAISSSAELEVSRVTIASDGLFHGAFLLGGSATIRSSTVEISAPRPGNTPATFDCRRAGSRIVFQDATLSAVAMVNDIDTATCAVSWRNTAISASTPRVCTSSDAFTEDGFSVSTLPGCGITRNAVSLGLGPLRENGGSTPTRLPRADSILVDASRGCLATDQRGVARPRGATCDIGAVER